MGLCSQYLQTGKCGRNECDQRHPKSCKWDKSNSTCRRGLDCMYLHGNVVVNQAHNYFEQNGNACQQFKCVGCKNTWEERNHVKSHTIQNMEVFFCLNCDDWVQEKAAVFDKVWTMFDEAGALRYDI